MDLPIYEMKINPSEDSDIEVMAVALVDKPAIERNFMMFKSQLLNFAIDNDKRIISGPAMVADVPIYRKDEGGEYHVFFSAATIKEIALKFAKKGYAKKLNLFHDPNLPADGVAIFNSFVSDKSMGILPMAGFEDLPEGSWFISAKVENEEIWKRIKSGEFRGFSVEGNFSFERNGPKQEDLHLIEKGLMSDLKNLMTSLKAALFSTNKMEFTLKDKSKVSIDKFEAGGKVTIGDKDAPTGKLEFLDGSSAVVGQGGAISSVSPAPAALEAIKAKLKDGTEVSITELVAGGVVMIGEAPAPAGEHELEDGTKVTVGEGGVITMVTPGAAAAMPPPADYTKEFAAVNEKFAGYEAKFAQYETKFTEQAAAIAKAQSINEQLFAIVQKLAEAPSADPASTSGNNFSTNKELTKEERRAELMANIEKLKKQKN